MSLRAPAPGFSAQRTRLQLETAVKNYDRDAAGHARLIRELLKTDRTGFYSGAIEILKTSNESRGAQCLITALATSELLIDALCEPTRTNQQGLALAQAAMQAGVMADVIVAKYLSECAAALGDSPCPPGMRRLMDILAEISDGTRVLPCLMGLARQTNPYLRSKAVLMIGRISRSVKWVLNRLMEPDPRVRANAIEALWGIDTEEVRRLLRAAGRDANNRVAGNAIIALYKLGDGWAIPELFKLAHHESRRARATAAWIMGETGDPRFTKKLARMLGEPNIAVRTRAFAALGQIRAATAQARQASERRVVARFQRDRRSGWRELSVEVSSGDGSEQIRVLPTQFILLEDGREVVSSSIEERPIPPSLAVMFIPPRTPEPHDNFQSGALVALEWKRPSDLWSIAPYLPTRPPDRHASLAGQRIDLSSDALSAGDVSRPQFTCDSELLAAAFGKPALQVDCSDLWSTIRRSVQIEGGLARFQRHVVLYSQSETGLPGDYPKLACSAMASLAAVHAISLTANSALESLCQSTHGSFQTVASEDEVASVVEQVCLRLQANYTVRYQPDPDACQLRIIVNTPLGWGETTLSIPR